MQQDVSASTQNQAFSALLFLYAKVIGRPKADPVGLASVVASARREEQAARQ